jgi:UPF0755 protein
MDEPLTYIQEPTPLPMLPAPKWWHRLFLSAWQRKVLLCLLVPVAFLFVVGYVSSAPAGFPFEKVFSVKRGETLSGAAEGLREAGFIRSEFLFKSYLSLIGGTKGLTAGDYYFTERQGVLGVAWRLSRGQYGLENVRVTIPEGFSSVEIAERIKARFNTFDDREFIRIAAPYEGYLFPDTYFFLPNVSPEEVVSAMTLNYQDKIRELADEIAKFGKPIRDVITMASIIEEEARTEESRRTIAGILWKRLSIGMPLQVDAAFAFVNGKKASSELTLDDLKIESPYNTYVNKGLPPGPISNPGLDSIRATVTPLSTKYFYYLTDAQGIMRYAVTHDQHVENKFTYLK